MAFRDDIRRVSLRSLILGVIAGWFVAGGATYFLLTVPTFDEKARIELSGVVEDVQTPRPMKLPALDFSLQGQEVRFRVMDAIFAEALGAKVPPQLQPGAQVTVTVEKAEYDEPFSPEPFRVPTVSADAIRVGDRDVLSLDASRRWHAQNRFYAQVIVPVFVLCALFLTYVTVVRLKGRS